jgi:hypothetical protein
MSVLVHERAMTPRYLRLKCPCGRDLRARPEQAGSSITCWSCHASVPVPIPVAPGGWVSRVLRMTARQILEARTFTLLVVGAVLVTVALTMASLGVSLGPAMGTWVPRPGVWGAGLALGLVMVGYGELLRRGCQGDWTPRPHVSPVAKAWRTFICLGLGLALILPLIIASTGQTPPRITPTGMLIALGATMVLPLVMLGTYSPEGSVSDRVRLVFSLLKRHPMATLAALLVLPLSLPVIETLVFAATRLSSTFSFMLFDLFPSHQGIRTLGGIPYYAPGELRMKWMDFREASDSLILGSYLESLTQGYTLLGAIPASLAMDTSNGLYLGAINLNPTSYLAHRMFFTLMLVTGMLCALAVQARWLGLLSTIDSRRSAASSGSTGLHSLPNLSPETS